MSQPTPPIRLLPVLAIALAMVLVGGCASNRLPRIDPTGQRMLLWPDEPTPPITAPPQALAPTLVPGATAALPPAPANVEAPPVLTDPFLPGGPGNTTTDWLGRPVVVGPPVSSTTGQPVAGAVAMPTVPGEALSITPSRILAPVGSEVILIGGVCAENGYLRTNERVEWMLDRAGTGQIVTVGGRGELDMFRLPQNTPRKVDNFFAITATSPYRDCLDRGTPDPNDDVQIRRGDAWITVSSPTEGTSYVTAYAPNVPNWAGRTARATIYWIDAQWAFPPSVTLAPGQSHTLTTSITRQSDGAPIAGWIVRYKVAGNSAGLGYEGGQTSDVPTDAQGRASVEITPTDDRAGVTNVEIEIIRPEQAGLAASPRVTLATGAASISWADGGITGTPIPTGPPPSLEPTPVTPPTDSWSSPNTPEPTPEPTPAEGQPDLVLNIEQVSPGPFRVGDTVEFMVTVKNNGNGTARNVQIRDDFDVGLSSSVAPAGQQFIVGEDIVDMVPGKEIDLPLAFRITSAGQLSHTVTVTADNALQNSRRASINVEGTGGATGGETGGGFIAPQLRVTLDAPLRCTVGEVRQFKVIIENLGNTPARNVVVTLLRDPELKAVAIDPNRPYDEAEFRSSGKIRWTTPVIAANSKEVYLFECECLAGEPQPRAEVQVTAEGLTELKSDQRVVEIRPQLGGGVPAAPPLDNGGTSTAPPATATEAFEIAVWESKNPARLQDRFTISARVTNTSQSVQRNVRVRVYLPPNLRGDFQQVQSAQPAHTEPWNEGVGLFVDPIPQLAAGESYQIMIPVDAVSQGNVKVYVGVGSDDAPQELTFVRDIQVL